MPPTKDHSIRKLYLSLSVLDIEAARQEAKRLAARGQDAIGYQTMLRIWTTVGRLVAPDFDQAMVALVRLPKKATKRPPAPQPVPKSAGPTTRRRKGSST